MGKLSPFQRGNILKRKSNVTKASQNNELEKKVANVCLLNARSIKNKCHIRDLVIDNSIDLFFSTETWIQESDTCIIANFLTDTHKFLHVPRKDKVIGGVGVIV